SCGRGAVPAGVSVGSGEAEQLLDGDATRFAGRGVLKAVRNVREIIGPALIGMPASQQEAIDRKLIEMDGTPGKSRLGSNAILAVSLATAQAAAANQKLPLYKYLGGEGPFALPVPVFDMFRGGAHGRDSVDFQEYLVIPAGLSSFREALEAGFAIYRAMVELLQQKGFSIYPTGPLAAPLKSNREAVEVVASAIERTGYKLGEQCFIGIDAATSELYQDGNYVLQCEGRELTSSELADLWIEWTDAYPIVSIEDAMAEEDWGGWQALTKQIGDRVQLVGDDLFTTNPEQVKKGIALGAANAVLIKPNQIGTLSETLETIRLANEAGWAAQVSTRSGETEDTAIADLSVLGGCGQIKMGPPHGTTVIKTNRLLRIEEELGAGAEYKGMGAFKNLAK
ncbi:MAG: phosphopyruvate hydratase, partial [Dehalococcoidia bacterium]